MMRALFADTAYYLALLNADDGLHIQARQLTVDLTAGMVTTDWVLTEVADALSRPPVRRTVIQFVRDLRSDPQVRVVPSTRRLFDAGLDLFSRRLDKGWTLTDCISFVVMKRLGLKEALTADRHFQQAGFVALLK